MPFSPATFQNRTSPNVTPLRYAVRRTTSTNKVCTLQISASRTIVKAAGINEGDGIRLDFDVKAGLGRIIAIPNAPRSFRGKGRKGAAYVASWPYNGDVEKHFPKPAQNEQKGSGTVSLVVTETSKGEGLVFELPTI